MECTLAGAVKEREITPSPKKGRKSRALNSHFLAEYVAPVSGDPGY